MQHLLPKVNQFDKKIPSHVLREPVHVTPTKTPFGTSGAENTPPMSKLLKSSQKLLKASHDTEKVARDLLAEIENSPTSKNMFRSVKKSVKKKKKKKVNQGGTKPTAIASLKTSILAATSTTKETRCAMKIAKETAPAPPTTVEKAHVRMERLAETLNSPIVRQSMPFEDTTVATTEEKIDAEPPKPPRRKKVRRNKRKERRRAFREAQMLNEAAEQETIENDATTRNRERCDVRIVSYVMSYIRSTRIGRRVIGMVSSEKKV